MKRELSKFGNVFSKIRKKQKTSLKEASKLLGYSPSYLSAIEHGDRTVPRGLIEKICKVYHLGEAERSELVKSVSLGNSIYKFSISEIKKAMINMTELLAKDDKEKELLLKRLDEFVNSMISQKK